MDFEQAFENYKNGTATDEERAYVESVIEKARKLSLLLDEVDAKKEVITPSNISDIKRAKKQYTVKSVIKIAIVAVACLVIIAGVTCAGVFGQAFSSAKKNTSIDTEQAKSIAIAFVDANYDVPDGVQIHVTETEKEIHFSANLAHCYYNYYVDLQTGTGTEIELLINGKTGVATLDTTD